MTNESKPIEGYEGLYEIYPNGDIYSLTKRVFLRPRINNVGYMEVRLRKNKKTLHKSIHRMLAKAFISNPYSKPCIDHIDGNKLNNNLSNLRWCTHKENSNNPHCLKLCSESASKTWKNGRKMSEEAIKKRSEGHYKPVAQYTRNGEFIRIWDSVKDASIELGICDSQIASVCRGNTPKKTAGSFVFKYIKKRRRQEISRRG